MSLQIRHQQRFLRSTQKRSCSPSRYNFFLMEKKLSTFNTASSSIRVLHLRKLLLFQPPNQATDFHESLNKIILQPYRTRYSSLGRLYPSSIYDLQYEETLANMSQSFMPLRGTLSGLLIDTMSPPRRPRARIDQATSNLRGESSEE